MKICVIGIYMRVTESYLFQIKIFVIEIYKAIHKINIYTLKEKNILSIFIFIFFSNSKRENCFPFNIEAEISVTINRLNFVV